MQQYEVFPTSNVPIKAWVRGVPVEASARSQLENIAGLPFVHKWVAAMPDVHMGKGATVGSVIPTVGAIIPAAVGVDIGCGMMAVQTSLRASDLPDGLHEMRTAIERAVPHGRTNHGGSGDRGAWGRLPAAQRLAWAELSPTFEKIAAKHPKIGRANHVNHLGTLGTGNHFIEVCLDEAERVWFMLHSGSRGDRKPHRQLLHRAGQGGHAPLLHQPARSRSGLSARGYEPLRRLRRGRALGPGLRHDQPPADDGRGGQGAAGSVPGLPPFTTGEMAVNCHHNYVAREHHYGKNVYRDAQGRGARAQGRPRHHPRQHGRALVHRARKG